MPLVIVAELIEVKSKNRPHEGGRSRQRSVFPLISAGGMEVVCALRCWPVLIPGAQCWPVPSPRHGAGLSSPLGTELARPLPQVWCWPVPSPGHGAGPSSPLGCDTACRHYLAARRSAGVLRLTSRWGRCQGHRWTCLFSLWPGRNSICQRPGPPW